MSDHLASMDFDPRVASVTSTTSLLPRPIPTPIAMLRAGSSSSIDTETPYSAGAGSKLPLLQDQVCTEHYRIADRTR
ncbi:hypothetical protein PILCRDRAFT_168326 [Piloderma croceum F 1598]|uniref:Uncharacterized protein n=1 Tax=Piloderma croceum (strain F 1598) TaxID=765440 RepID=A0A0C3CNC2_PILCF|nr:hypothetical protein PILCRDRAFT_168326 [Piloderma croceum F 1598]